MVTAYIGLGCNLGDCRENLQKAWARLGEVKGVELLCLSNPYRSEPVGMASENWFINAVGSLHTSLQPKELLAEMFAVEASLGRIRDLSDKPEDRTVDLDLLYWGKRVSDAPEVVLPHPEIANRIFVLLPLAEIGPDLRHPVLQKTSNELLQEYKGRFGNGIFCSQVQLTSWSIKNSEVSR